MEWRTVLTEAHARLREVVANVPADGWDRPTPCEKWTVAQVVQHAAGDQVAYAAALGAGPWPTDDPFAPSGTIAGDPRSLVQESTARVGEAYAALADDAPEVTVPLPGGPYPAWLAAGAAAPRRRRPRLGHRGGDRSALAADRGPVGRAARRGAAAGRAAARVRLRRREGFQRRGRRHRTAAGLPRSRSTLDGVRRQSLSTVRRQYPYGLKKKSSSSYRWHRRWRSIHRGASAVSRNPSPSRIASARRSVSR